jgi:hypothetical protein
VPSSRKSTRGRLSHSASLRARQRRQGWKYSTRGVAVSTFTSRRLRRVFCSSEDASPRSIFVASVAQHETCVNSLSGSGALTFDMSLWSRQAFIGSLSGTCWEGHFHMVLANAQHIKAVPGRKTDMMGCQSIAELLRHGLLRGSYVPSPVIRDLRDLTRTRRSSWASAAASRSCPSSHGSVTRGDSNMWSKQLSCKSRIGFAASSHSCPKVRGVSPVADGMRPDEDFEALTGSPR